MKTFSSSHGLWEFCAYDVKVRRTKVFERAFNRCVYVLRTVSAVVAFECTLLVEIALLLPLLSNTLQTSEFGRDHHLISSTSSFHPLAKPLLALSELIIHRCVNEIAALLVEVIQDSERCFLGTLTE